MLEGAGDRTEAARVRVAATASYSRAWDDRARRELEALLRRAERRPPPNGRWAVACLGARPRAAPPIDDDRDAGALTRATGSVVR